MRDVLRSCKNNDTSGETGAPHITRCRMLLLQMHVELHTNLFESENYCSICRKQKIKNHKGCMKSRLRLWNKQKIWLMPSVSAKNLTLNGGNDLLWHDRCSSLKQAVCEIRRLLKGRSCVNLGSSLTGWFAVRRNSWHGIYDSYTHGVSSDPKTVKQHVSGPSPAWQHCEHNK